MAALSRIAAAEVDHDPGATGRDLLISRSRLSWYCRRRLRDLGRRSAYERLRLRPPQLAASRSPWRAFSYRLWRQFTQRNVDHPLPLLGRKWCQDFLDLIYFSRRPHASEGPAFASSGRLDLSVKSISRLGVNTTLQPDKSLSGCRKNKPGLFGLMGVLVPKVEL